VIELAVTCAQDTNRHDAQRAYMDWVVADLHQRMDEREPTWRERLWFCHDCRTPQPGSYRTTDEVWAEYGCGPGVLCLPCLDKRMGLAWQQLDLFERL
jgi:hypothetical protein